MRRDIFIVFLWFICLLASAANAETPETTLHGGLPPYVVVETADSEMGRMADSLFYRISGSTIFKVNRTELNPSDPFLKELIDSVLPLVRSHELILTGMDMRGAASPEGPYANNVRLSKGRSKALTDLITENLDTVNLPESRLVNVAEDYPYLLWLLERDGDSAAPLLRRIMERHGADNCAAIKADLRKAYGGRVWNRLLRDYFPRLRAARVVLYFAPESLPKILSPFVVSHASIEAEPEGTIPYIQVPPFRRERRHLLALSSNLLYDAFYMPNYGWAPLLNAQLEYFPRHGNFTWMAGFTCAYYHRWSHQQFFQVRDYHLECRRYFKPGPRHLGAYLGLYLNGNIYGIGLSAKKGWQGEGGGGAIKAGYVLPLGKGRWRMDFFVALGCYATRFDPYVYGNPITGEIDGDYYYDWTEGSSSFKRRNHRFFWAGPTEIGISISFDVLFRKRPK